MSKLLIVESPTKAKTISKFLGKDYQILSSFGHVRDLPKSKLGVDVEHSFTPDYIIPTKSRKHVTELKKAAAKADAIYFATDEDREGEAISWHLAEILNVTPELAQRITFHEITKSAIEKALEHPRLLDMRLVDAQQARRILDRLVGYSLSPLLWKKVQRGLSAGRVQSVSVRLVVERERERRAFIKEEYWSIDAMFTKDDATFEANLISYDGKKIEKMDIKSEAEATAMVSALAQAEFIIGAIQKKRIKKTPPVPLTTSTLQQEANNRLGMSAKLTMQLAQQLYETGRITYMRTDSLNLAESFLEETKSYLQKTFGASYALSEARHFKTKSKGAQEAHEAIRPTDPSATPDALKSELEGSAWKLYNLIWRRTLATQMPEAELERTALDLKHEKTQATFRANGSTIVFDGFMKVYKSAKETLLPILTEGKKLPADTITPNQHSTEPPARYSDASLVKALEENGIGRPSTYAPTIATIIARGYVERDEQRKLAPTPVAEQVTDLLIEHFPNIVDYTFTATMEQNLDDIAEGKMEWVPMLTEFYGPFSEALKAKEITIEKIKQPEIATDQVCEKCSKPMVIKTGRFGQFLACTGFPDCRNTKAILKTIGVNCPECKEGEMSEKKSKRGKVFYSCNRYPDCKFALWNKPTGELCPNCGSLLTISGKEKISCSKKECDYKV